MGAFWGYIRILCLEKIKTETFQISEQEQLPSTYRNDRPVIFMPKTAFLGPQMVYLETLYSLTLFLLLDYLLLQIKFTLVQVGWSKTICKSSMLPLLELFQNGVLGIHFSTSSGRV